MVFARDSVNVLQFVARCVPHFARDMSAMKRVQVCGNVVNSGLRVLAIISVSSIKMGIDRNEFAVYEKLSKQFAITIFLSWLALTNKGIASNGS